MFSNQDSIPLCIAGMLYTGSASDRLPNLWHFPFIYRYTGVYYLCCNFTNFSGSHFINLFFTPFGSFIWLSCFLYCTGFLGVLWSSLSDGCDRKSLVLSPGQSPVTMQTSAPDNHWNKLSVCEHHQHELCLRYPPHEANGWLTACENSTCLPFSCHTAPAGSRPALHFIGNDNNDVHKSSVTNKPSMSFWQTVQVKASFAAESWCRVGTSNRPISEKMVLKVSAEEPNRNFDPTWGRFKVRFAPSVGKILHSSTDFIPGILQNT